MESFYVSTASGTMAPLFGSIFEIFSTRGSICKILTQKGPNCKNLLCSLHSTESLFLNSKFSPRIITQSSFLSLNYGNGRFSPQTFVTGSILFLKMVILVLKLSHLTHIHTWPIAKYPFYPSPILAHRSLLANWSYRSQFAPTKEACKNIRACTKAEEVLGREILQMPPVPREELPKNEH
jgi:hypothetical protein